MSTYKKYTLITDEDFYKFLCTNSILQEVIDISPISKASMVSTAKIITSSFLELMSKQGVFNIDNQNKLDAMLISIEAEVEKTFDTFKNTITLKSKLSNSVQKICESQHKILEIATTHFPEYAYPVKLEDTSSECLAGATLIFLLAAGGCSSDNILAYL